MPSRQTEPAEVAALEAAWWPELEDRTWIDAEVWGLAVREAQATCQFRPALSEMLGICEYVAVQVEQERWRASAPALPPPTTAAGEAPGVTPEERERWAKEDAFIRGYIAAALRRREEGAYLNDWGPYPTRPGVWVRTAPEDMEWARRVWEIEDALARVPGMTPEQRRARDRRIEAEKARARERIESLAGRVGRWPGSTAKPKPLTEEEIDAAYARRGRERER